MKNYRHLLVWVAVVLVSRPRTDDNNYKGQHCMWRNRHKKHIIIATKLNVLLYQLMSIIIHKKSLMINNTHIIIINDSLHQAGIPAFSMNLEVRD